MTRNPFRPRRLVVASIAMLGLWSWWRLGLSAGEVLPGFDDLGVVATFVSHGLSPAFGYESAFVPSSAPPFLLKVLDASKRTLIFAAAAMSLALPLGVVLGFLGAASSWRHDLGGVATPANFIVRRCLAPSAYVTARILMTVTRSVHELLWAVLLLSAVGLTNLAAVVAIAIPYSGTLAKVFSEMIDETPSDAADALRDLGAAPTQTFLLGRVTRALPDMGAYAFYRFECALRSSALVGFFGPETLGKFIRQSWDENHYGEVWTYLYALFLLVLVFDWWSGAMRRRFVA